MRSPKNPGHERDKEEPQRPVIAGNRGKGHAAVVQEKSSAGEDELEGDHANAEPFRSMERNGMNATKPALQFKTGAYSKGAIQRVMAAGPYAVKEGGTEIGSFRIDAEEGDNPQTKGRGLNTKITYTMNEAVYKAFSTSHESAGVVLNMIQGVKTTIPTTGAFRPVNAERGKMAISDEEAKKEGVQPGWSIDVPYEKAKAGEDFSPFYGDHGIGEVFTNRNVVILGDFPSSTGALKFDFETSVWSLTPKMQMGALEWGFVVSGTPLAVSGEYARSKPEASNNVLFALKKHSTVFPEPKAEMDDTEDTADH